MKNYLLKTRRNSHLSSRKRALIKIFLATAALILLTLLLRGALGSFFSGAAVRIQEIRNYFASSSAAFPSYIRERSELDTEIERLREELASQSGSRATIARLAYENDSLRSLLSTIGEERILGGVIARPPSVPYDVLVIDRGSIDGVQEGALVYHESDHVLGVISRVYDRASVATLFSSAGAETTVYIYGPDVFAYAYGEGGGVIRISIPQGITLTEGDPVVLPTVFSGDIGTIERIVSSPSQPEQNAYVTFPVSLQSIKNVSIGTRVVEPKPYEELVADVERIRERFRIEVPDAARMGTATTSTTTEAVPTP